MNDITDKDIYFEEQSISIDLLPMYSFFKALITSSIVSLSFSTG